MTKTQYFKLCMREDIPVKWLAERAANPNKYMTQTHVRLIRLAIRKRTQPEEI